MHTPHNMHEGLLRQRRNLIITSVILWFLKYGKVSLKQISMAGFDIKFENPDVLTLSLWIAFAYFYFRYYQYFVEEGLIFFRDKLARAKNESFSKLLLTEARNQYPSLIFHEHATRYDGYVTQGRKLYGENNPGQSTSLVNVHLPFYMSVCNTFLAFINLTFRSSAVTDYLLPFLLADFVLYYCGVPDWGGSYLRLILGM